MASFVWTESNCCANVNVVTNENENRNQKRMQVTPMPHHGMTTNERCGDEIFNLKLQQQKAYQHSKKLQKDIHHTTCTPHDDKKEPTVAAGFEPAREFPNGFQVHRLNHSAKQPKIMWGDKI